MAKEEKQLKKWIREHKKELIIAGVSAVTIMAVIIGIRHCAEIEEFMELFKKDSKITKKTLDLVNIEQSTKVEEILEVVDLGIQSTKKAPHIVSEHIRELPDGWHASAIKVAAAEARGIILKDGQTLVESYRTGGIAA